MGYIIVGLGNPGDEYRSTRHNTGRMAVAFFADKHGVDTWKADKALKAQRAKVADGIDATLLLPDTFMNKSGLAVKPLITSEKKAQKLIVIYDDLDLPFGAVRIKKEGGSGGHRGMESIIRSIKTKAFIRIRIGISPVTPKGTIKKPKGEEAVIGHILKPFSKKELEDLASVFERVSEALELIVQGEVEKAMNQCNERMWISR